MSHAHNYVNQMAIFKSIQVNLKGRALNLFRCITHTRLDNFIKNNKIALTFVYLLSVSGHELYCHIFYLIIAYY